MFGRIYSPIRTAPAISATVAIQHAWRRVTTFAPTLVPKTLATSFAPTPKASVNAKIKPTTMIHKVDECQSESHSELVVTEGMMVVGFGIKVLGTISAMSRLFTAITVVKMNTVRNMAEDLSRTIFDTSQSDYAHYTLHKKARFIYDTLFHELTR